MALKQKLISQYKLRMYLRLKKEIDELTRKFNTVKEDLTKAAEQGLPIQPGPLGLKIQVVERSNVSWKTQFIKFVGEDKAREILESAPRSSYKKVIVTDRSNVLDEKK